MDKKKQALIKKACELALEPDADYPDATINGTIEIDARDVLELLGENDWLRGEVKRQSYVIDMGSKDLQTIHALHNENIKLKENLAAIQSNQNLEFLIKGHMDAMRPLLDEWHKMRTEKLELCPPHKWDKSGEKCLKCGGKDWMT